MSDSGETARLESARLACMSLDAALCHAACDARDPRFDGRFFIGVTSTGVYCRCVCPARMTKPQNRRFFASPAAAERGGFRPCLLCRPEAAPGLAPIDRPGQLAQIALTRIEEGALEEMGLEALAGELGVTDRHLRRVTLEAFGASPIELAQTHRLLTAKRLLAETHLSMTDVALASGFRSLRRFNAAFQESYRLSPSQIRRKAASPGIGLTLQLAARAPWRRGPSFAFLAMRALAGVESAGPDHYARTLMLAGRSGWLQVRATEKGIAATVSESLAPALRPLIVKLRRSFDLDADIAAIDAHLARDPALAGAVASDPAIRLVGGLDPFEIAVRAVCGQQVTAKAGVALTARLAAAFGAPIAGGEALGLTHLFPTAAQLGAASVDAIAALGMPRKRAQTLVTLAQAVSADSRALAPERLVALPGIGPWTAGYVALRAFHDPDAFPPGDAALINAMGGDRRAQPRPDWAPWRGYAALRLWRSLAKEEQKCP
jgi:AraC family transcriptional regulator, regulatory protein of adaptative response / DNA-3-methyladenine glycosylase II